jgi:putative glycosyltransferase (TIGR04372 family)
MDIFLISESKFLIGTCSGLHGIAYLFKVPILGLNFIPIFDATLSQRDMWMPKKIWIKNEKKFMKFSDMFTGGLMHGSISDNYLASCGLEAVDNSDEEIFNAVVEMNSMVDSNLEITEKDEWLWNRFKSIVNEKCNQSHVILNSKSRISPKFLIHNENLLY